MGVVIINQSPPPDGIAVYPILKGGLNLLLLVLGQASFFDVWYSLFLPVYVLDIIDNLGLVFLIGGLFGVCYRLEFRPFSIDRYFYSGLLWVWAEAELAPGP